MELDIYLHRQNLKTSAILDSGARIPFTLAIVFEFGEKSHNMGL